MKFVPSDQSKMFSMRIIILCTIMLCIIAVSSTSLAATYYVDKNIANTSDSNLGTEASPLKTIQKAADLAVAGDIVYVKEAVYFERVVVRNSGSSGKRITFIAYPGDRPVIDGSRMSLSTWTGLFDAKNKTYITLDGFEIRNSNEVLILIQGCDYAEIKNCIVHDNVAPSRRSGIILAHSDNGLIHGNEVYTTSWNGINILSSTNTSANSNYVHDCTKHNGINIFPETDEPQIQYSGNNVKNNTLTRNHGGIYSRYQTNNEISNNLIYDNSDYGIYLENDQKDPHKFRADSIIVNNTIVKNGGCALLNGNTTYLTIKNNIFSNSSSYAIYMRSGLTAGHNIDNNLYYPTPKFGWDGKTYSSLSSWQSTSKQDVNSATADPFFANTTTDDFRLTDGSINAIDKGEDLSSIGISKDIIGTPRPQGNRFDIGAYEFKSGGGDQVLVLNFPRNLRIE